MASPQFSTPQPTFVVIVVTIVLAVVCFATGWLGYGWVFQQVTEEISQSVLVDSVDKAFKDRLMLSLSSALAGATIGTGAWLSGRYSKRRYMRHVAILLVVMVIASGGWLLYSGRRVASLLEYVQSLPGLSAALSLSDIHLYGIGLFASGCSLIAVLLILLFQPPPSGPVNSVPERKEERQYT